MNKKFEKINVDALTHERLAFISKITNVPMARIISQFIEELFSLAIEYDHAYLKIESSILASEVRVVCMGYGKKISVGSFKVPSEMSNEECDKIIDKQVLEKINSDLEEDKK